MDHSIVTKDVSFKYIGVIFDHKLNWIDYITYIKKIWKGIGILYKAIRYSNIFFYYAYIYPCFTYGIEVWGSAAKCHVNSLLLLHKKSIRIISFS